MRPVHPIPGSTALWEIGIATRAGISLRFIVIAPPYAQHFNDTGSTSALEEHLRSSRNQGDILEPPDSLGCEAG